MMAELQEKDSKNEVIVAESHGEHFPGSEKRPRSKVDGQPYTESKKTWKSFFWSSKIPQTSEQGKVSC